MHNLLHFAADCWLPILATLGLALTLYNLGKATERRRQRRLWADRLRHHNAHSILRHL